MEREVRSLVGWIMTSKLYHALYRLSEIIGTQTWGDNTEIYREFIVQIPEDIRLGESFNMLLLGAATSTSIEEALMALEKWHKEDLIGNFTLTVMDVNSRAFDDLNDEVKTKIRFVKADIRKHCFQERSFHFITSDYVLNFVHPEDITETVSGLSNLLVNGGMLACSVETIPQRGYKKVTGLVEVRNRLRENEFKASLNRVENLHLVGIRRAVLKGFAKTSHLTADCNVYCLRKNK